MIILMRMRNFTLVMLNNVYYIHMSYESYKGHGCGHHLDLLTTLHPSHVSYLTKK